MSTTTTTTPASPTYTIKRHHIHWGILLLLLVVIAIAVGAYEGGQVLYVGGKPVLAVPSSDALKGIVQFKTPNGQIVEAQVVPPAQPASNGQTSATTDDFGPDHQLQRTVTDTNRYNPIDRLTADIAATNNNVKATNESVKALSGQMSIVGDKVSQIENQISKIDNRVAKLEKQAPAPEVPATPGPTSQAAPVQPAPAPVASAPVGRRFTQNDAQVKLDTSNIPAGWKISGFERGNANESCPASKGLKLVASAKWVLKNGRHFFPNECVSMSDPRPAH